MRGDLTPSRANGAFANEEKEEPRVEMWNTRSHKRLMGQNRPFRRDVNDFMRRRPEYVLYSGQDREPKRPTPKPPNKRKKEKTAKAKALKSKAQLTLHLRGT